MLTVISARYLKRFQSAVDCDGVLVSRIVFRFGQMSLQSAFYNWFYSWLGNPGITARQASQDTFCTDHSKGTISDGKAGRNEVSMIREMSLCWIN